MGILLLLKKVFNTDQHDFEFFRRLIKTFAVKLFYFDYFVKPSPP